MKKKYFGVSEFFFTILIVKTLLISWNRGSQAKSVGGGRLEEFLQRPEAHPHTLVLVTAFPHLPRQPPLGTITFPQAK